MNSHIKDFYINQPKLLKMKKCLHYLYKIFFFTIILLTGCEKDELSTNQDYGESTNEDFNFTTKPLAITKMNDKDFKEIFEKLHISKKGMESKKVKLDFIIDSSRVVKIERENYTSWTIRIKKRDSSENSIDNLVIEMKGGENQTKAYILNYKLDYSTLIYNEEHGNYNFNSTKTITTIDFDASGLLGAREECFMITILMCDWGGDSHLAGDNCSAPYMYYQNYEECFYVPDGPGGLPVNSNDPDYGGSTITTLSLISEDEFSHVRNYVTSKLTLGSGKFWVKDLKNTSKVCQIYAFLVDNHLSEGAKAFAEEAVKAWRDGYEVVSIAPLVKYPKNSNYEKDYPKFTKYLREELPKLKENQKIIDAITDLVDIPDQVILDALTWGQGPIIKIEPLLGDAEGQYRGILSNVLSEELLHTIFIDIDLVNKFEDSDIENISEDALGFFLGVVILHEYVHLADYVYQDNFWDDWPNGPDEEGYLFEENAYGQRVKMENYELIFENFRQ